MLAIMLINLYTVRAYLAVLGETDYGLYNVIGGVVSIFSFINGTLATSSQRYFSQALTRGDKNAVKRTFCLNVTVYLVIAFVIVVFLESIGLWFVNTKLTIPGERLIAARVVYQISIVTFVLQLLTVSYTALIIAYEKMKAFAYIGIFEAVLKLGFVFVLVKTPIDKLIAYSFFMFLIYLTIAGLYFLYCKRNFHECDYSFYWNKDEAFEMLGFSGWHLLGTLSVVARGQGVNLLINMFFNPAVNAARAIAFQIEGAINRFSDNFFVAVKPQIYKSYSCGELEELNKLVIRSSLICFFLVSIFSIPLFFNVEYVLGLWLESVPKYTIEFTKYVLIGGLIDSVSSSAICPALATGKIKKFYLLTGSLYILVLPIAYYFLRLGYSPTSTMVVSITMSIIALFVRAYLLIDMISFHIKDYLFLLVKLTIATVIIGALTFCTTLFTNNMFLTLVLSVVVSVILHCILYLFFVCSSIDREAIIKIVKTKIVK